MLDGLAFIAATSPPSGARRIVVGDDARAMTAAGHEAPRMEHSVDDVERVNGQMDRERGAGRREGRKVSRGGIARRARRCGSAPSDCATSGRSVAPQRGRRRGEGGYAGRNREGNRERVEAARLLADALKIERSPECSRATSRRARAPRDCPTIASSSSGAVSTIRAPGGQWSSSAAGTSEPA